MKRERTQKGGKAKVKKGMKQHNLTKTVIGKTPPYTTKRLEAEDEWEESARGGGFGGRVGVGREGSQGKS